MGAPAYLGWPCWPLQCDSCASGLSAECGSCGSAQAAAIFAPRTLTVCVSAAAGDPAAAARLAPPPGYAALGCTRQALANGMHVAVHSLQALGQSAAVSAAVAAGAQAQKGAAQLPGMEEAAGRPVPEEECGAVAMQDDDDQKSELTVVMGGGFDLGGGGGAGEDAVLMAVGGYASSMASDLAKTRPSSPEADWAGEEL